MQIGCNHIYPYRVATTDRKTEFLSRHIILIGIIMNHFANSIKHKVHTTITIAVYKINRTGNVIFFTINWTPRQFQFPDVKVVCITNYFIVIIVSYPSKSAVAPFWTPTVHNLKCSAKLVVIVTDNTNGVASDFHIHITVPKFGYGVKRGVIRHWNYYWTIVYQCFLCHQNLVYFFSVIAEYQSIIIYFVVWCIVLQFWRNVVCTRFIVQQILDSSNIL